jgi:arylformamidase
MRIGDISSAVSPRWPVWPGDSPIVLECCMAISKGDVANVSRPTCSVYSSTRVDVPVHLIEKRSVVESLPVADWVVAEKRIETVPRFGPNL